LPVLEWVQQGLALGPKDTPDEQLRKIERGLGAVGVAPDEGVPLVAAFLGVPSPKTYPPLQMSPDLQRRKTMELLAAWILGLGEGQPLVLLMEDLHWSDPSSLELLGRLIAQSPTARVLLLGTARPDFQPPWPARSNLTTLQLARLTKRQAREMVMTLGASALRAEMVETLIGRADGVPLYIEELTKAVLEPGAAQTVEAIPATLADSLMDRLDRLSTAKEVAQRAAVLGREFSYALLAAAAGLEEAVLKQGLTRLIEGEIVFVRGEPPSATYTFKEALVQEAAYGSLLKTMRQQLHANVVDVLLDQFPMKAASEPEVVARHAEAAGRIDEAITYLQRAGAQAQERSAHAEAIAHFRKGIGLLGMQADGGARDAREVTLQLSLGASLVAARGYAHPETEAAYERARLLAERWGDAARLGAARIGLSTVYGNRGEIERARALAAEVLAAAEARGDAEQALIGHDQVAVPEHYQGRFASSLAHCERTLTLYEPAQHHDVARVFSTDNAVGALGYMAWNFWHLGRPDRALAGAEEAVARARRLTHPFSLAFALFFEAASHWSRRDHARQRERSAEVIALSEEQGFPLWLGLGRAWHAAARMAAGDAGALDAIADGLALAGETGSQAGAPALFGLLAEAQHAAGELAAAQATVATGLAIAAQTGQPFWDADLHRLDGDLLFATGGAADQAATHYHRALAIAREQGARSFELRAAISLARLWQRQGEPAEARALLAPVYAWFTEGFDTGDLVEAKALLDELT
jgi:predicted ATPase